MSRRQKKNLIRIIISAILLCGLHFVPFDKIPNGNAVGLAVYLVPYIISGYDIILSAIRNILRGQVFDENLLMAVASAGAFVIGDYPEAVTVMVLYQTGELFQSVAVGKSRKSVAALMDIRPDSATVVRNGVAVTVSPDEVEVGETIIISPGERIPLDGRIIEGSTTVNTSALTGEALPQELGRGDCVISGTVNLSGVIRAEVTSCAADSTVARILDLVENATAKKAKSEAFITRFARVYTPAVVAAAVLLAVLPPVFTGQQFGIWLNRALIFLVVSCPCALVISVPLSFFGGIGGASRQGILIKGSTYIEVLSRVKTIVFDKTGTLTEGVFEVTAIHPEKITEAELLDLAAAAESFSTHPIGESIVAAHGGHVDRAALGSVEEISGLGIIADYRGHRVAVGNPRLMERESAQWHECRTVGTTVHIAQDGIYMGHIVISDRIKSDSAQAIKALRSQGVKRAVMLTGDSEAVAADVAAKLGLDEFHAGLLPADKVSIAERLIDEKNAGEALAFVGDGINDAPVLARADIGIAMGALGSDAAIEAADVVLMDDKPSKIAAAVACSRKTMRIVYENIILALTVKFAVLILSAFGITGMWLAIFADVGVMMLAIINAVRTLKTPSKK